jgi:hypothetical protein
MKRGTKNPANTIKIATKTPAPQYMYNCKNATTV